MAKLAMIAAVRVGWRELRLVKLLANLNLLRSGSQATHFVFIRLPHIVAIGGSDPSDEFYLDYLHPTQVGIGAVADKSRRRGFL